MPIARKESLVDSGAGQLDRVALRIHERHPSLNVTKLLGNTRSLRTVSATSEHDAMANEPLRHFLARAQSRVAALRSDVMARLANTHARLIEKFGGNTEKPQADYSEAWPALLKERLAAALHSDVMPRPANTHTRQRGNAGGDAEKPQVNYSATWQALLEERLAGQRATSRGIRVSLERYLELAARAAWHLNANQACKAASLQSLLPDAADEDTRASVEEFRASLLRDHLPRTRDADVSPAASQIAWLRTVDPGLKPLSIPSTQVYTCLRLWRAKGLLERRTGGSCVGGPNLARGDRSMDVGTRFFDAAAELYRELTDAKSG
jgi:hypothetical protein